MCHCEQSEAIYLFERLPRSPRRFRNDEKTVTIFFIDTTQKEHHLALIKNGKIATRYDFLAENNIDNQFQQELDTFLKDNKISVRNINSLIVNTGPGTFTGTRTGIAFANALKLANPEIELRKVSGENISDQQILDSLKKTTVNYLVPEYSNPPSITSPKA